MSYHIQELHPHASTPDLNGIPGKNYNSIRAILSAMNMKQLAAVGVLALVVTGCILAAGCISAPTQPSGETGTLPDVKEIAHRGLSSEAPENTMAAFRLACEDGRAWGVECDIFKTADDEFIISHDESMSRMCGVDKNVTDLTVEEIQQYKVISGNNVEEYPDEVFPTLEEFLVLLSAYPDIHAVIEIKVEPFTDSDAEQLLDLCTRYLPPERICIIGENMDTLLKLQELDKIPDLQWVGDTYSWDKDAIQWCIDHDIDVDVNYELATPEVADLLHKGGVELNVWTINDLNTATDMVERVGVDYITGNYLY